MVRDLDFYNILILYNDEFYKELDLDEIKEDWIIVGNTKDSTIKLNFNKYDNISVKFLRRNDSWVLSGANQTYCVINGVKVPRKNLVNGDKVVIKNIETKEELLRINYFIDFVVEEEDYNRQISLNKIKKLKIGSSENNNVIIDSKVIKKNHAEVLSKNYKYFLKDLDSEYGTFLNGRQINEKVELKDNDFIILGGYKFLFKDEKLYMSQTNKIHIKGVEDYIKPFNSLLTYPCFYRSPRLLKDVPEDDVIIDPPPTKEKEQSANNLIVTLIPLLGTAALTLSVQATKDDKSSLVLTIGMAALTGIVALFTFAMELYKVKKNQYVRYKRYKEYVKNKEQLIVEKRKLLMESIRNNNPDTEDCITFLENFNRRLWERTPNHKDFLNISLGRGDGDLTFDIKVESKKVEVNIDKLKDDPRKLKDKYGSMEDVPICINFTEDYPVGIYGARRDTIELIKNIVIKISTFHYYEDVKIAAIFPKKEEKMWEWLKWIPHTWNKDKTFRYIGDTKESAHNVLNQLYDEIKQRGCDEEVNDEEKIYLPYYVIIISDRVLIENEPIMEIIESNKNYGACGIFAYEDLGLIPKDSKKIVNVQNMNTAEYINVINSNKVKIVNFTPIKDVICDNFSRKMCPIYVKNSFTQSSLTSYFTLFDLYNIKSEEELPIITNWNKNKVYKTMAVPLGVRAGNEIVYLNLHEKFHGPHGLVAGTTGSGKSEILQTYIASLAINYHPYDISIIIIDYKGGGMANQFKNLPHLVGTITNLDGNQINRALISIKSELKRRQRIFSEYNVNHIDSYIKLYKEGKAKEPLPHLIMIADEFAELKNDQPDFMTELVSAARIGRSLGVHLILATQKPSGVVDDQIWSNSKFKLCLKVQDADDSNEMIKSPLAASIVEAGRAYFQVGNNEIFELFQSAWSGAKKYDNDDISKKEIEISEVLIDGSRKVIYSTKEEEKNKECISQLDAIINEVQRTAIENNIKKLNGPWLPPLQDIIYLNDIIGDFSIDELEENKEFVKACIGVFDDPEMQIQDKLKLNLSEEGNMMLIGSPGTGKTTLLQTLITSLIQSYAPKFLNIYILDFGTRVLKIYENTPQIGGVITSDDEELLSNFMKLINQEIKKRKNILSDSGVSNVLSYREITGKVIPHILIIIDNFAAFTELYEDYEDEITKISRDGTNLGISLVITASNSSDIRYKISSNCKIVLTLNCVDDSEYSTVLGRASLEPAKNEGRGLIKLERICEYQTALPVKGESEGERTRNIQSLIKKLNENYVDYRAKRIPIFTENINVKDFLNDISDVSLKDLYIGIDVDEFINTKLNLENNSFIPVIGKPAIGKSNFLKVCALMINEVEEDFSIYVFDSQNYGLYDLQNICDVEFYSNDNNEIIDCLNNLREVCEERKDKIDDEIMESRGKVRDIDLVSGLRRNILLIDNINEFLNSLEDEYDALELFKMIVSKKSGYGFTVIASGEETQFADQCYNHDFMDVVKKNNTGVIMSELEDQDYFNIKLNYASKEKKVIPGDGYLVNKGEFSKIKIPVVI